MVGGAETFRDLTLVEELRKELSGTFRVGDLVSRSPAMRRIKELLPQLAESEATVLIQGETGTGKELLARAVHSHSPRRDKPFVALNCGALPDTLLESELFGYVKGVHGAARQAGRFAPRGGTLFLDEIGDISLAMQVRLLRVLQEQVYEPLGSVVPRKADVRIIAATHRDLTELIRKGEFREDFFYRLNVVRLDLPPLRHRKEDIPLLVDEFVARFNRRQGRRVPGITADALGLLMIYDFPGNVRELENIIERAFVLCGTGRIDTVHLPPELTGAEHPAYASTVVENLAQSRRTAEAAAIEEALAACGYNRRRAARALGLARKHPLPQDARAGHGTPAQDGPQGRINAALSCSRQVCSRQWQ